MEVIASGRQTGKTTELIKKCVQADKEGFIAYIVCHDHAATRNVVDLARELGEIIRYPITFEEAKNGYHMPHSTKLFIDNIDLYINKHFANLEVKAVTFNTEDNDETAS